MIAKRTNDITDEMWSEVNTLNRTISEEFITNQLHLSLKTKDAYKSGVRIFFYWVKENLEDKDFYLIKRKEFIKYLAWLTERGMSESAIKFKKSVISSFCSYIENFYEDEYPEFRTFVTKDMKVVSTGNVFDKEPLTIAEYNLLCHELEMIGDWQKLAWVKFTYSSGCRRAEARQLTKDMLDISPIVKEVEITDDDGYIRTEISKSYKTSTIRCKGRGVQGKQRKLDYSQDAMEAIQKWLEVRGNDDCPYVFVVKNKEDNGYHQATETSFNEWCAGTLTKLVGRRVHPHLLRESRATNLVVEEGKSVELAQQLLGHESSSTTSKHYIIRENEYDVAEAFLAM